MRRIVLWTLLLALLAPAAAHAQKSKADLTTEINTLFADNTIGAITPTKLRAVTTDIVNSYVDWLTCAGTGGLVYWASGVPTCLGAGTAGQVLKTNGGTLAPSWADVTATLVAGTGITITGTSPATISLTNQIVAGGPVGSATVTPVITYNAQGQLTAVSSVTIAPPFSAITGSLACSQTPALTGDVTTSAGSCATSIANGSLTYAKIQNVTAARLLGNPTGGAAAPSEISLGATLAFSGSALQTTAHTGDVTSPANSNAMTIAASAVTNSQMANMAAYTLKGNATGSAAAPTDISIPALTQKASPVAADKIMIADSAASNALKYATVSSISAAGSVASLGGLTGAVGLGNGLTTSANNILVSLSTVTNSLGADVAMNNTSNYFDGPSVAQGTSGTWFASGTVSVQDTSTAAQIFCKLWDGTTVIASGSGTTVNTTTTQTIALSGYLASPAANIRISCRDSASTSGQIRFNTSGNSKDSTVSVMRIN